MNLSHQRIAIKPLWLLLSIFLFCACDIGKEDQCIAIEISSHETVLDSLVVDKSIKNRIYSAKLYLKGDIEEKVDLTISNRKSLVLMPGSYDSLIFQGDWYADPMILELKGKSGSDLRFCATFFY